MSLVNSIEALELPILGQAYFRTEDQFLEPTFANSLSGSNKNDVSIPQEIIISCKNKRRRVRGFLSEGVKLSGSSKWNNFLSNSALTPLNKGLGTLDTLSQIGAGDLAGGRDDNPKGSTRGTSTQMPWMNRKVWNGTDPFSLQFSFNLVAEENSQTEVFEPAIALLSFLFPRTVSNVKIVETAQEFVGKHVSDTTNTDGKATIAQALLDLSKEMTFAIPGPSLAYMTSEDGENLLEDNGDAVTIVIGNMFAFGGCYLKDVSIEFSSNVDFSGYPTWCKCSISFETMDTNYCMENGDFLLNTFPQSGKGLSELIDACNTTIKQAAIDTANIAKKTMNAIGFFGQGVL